MTARNLLSQTPPYPVEQAIKRLGANLRTARLRRNLTIEEVAEKIGTGPRAVADAEKGKPSTGMVVYTALLWAYDLLEPMAALADPARDEEGLTLELSSGRVRARAKEELDNDF
jgi:transcriptional regulator with XRE-family HTH domain